jgi:hypothetical protein
MAADYKSQVLGKSGLFDKAKSIRGVGYTFYTREAFLQIRLPHERQQRIVLYKKNCSHVSKNPEVK